eukprot:NODE_5740_length_491_cov_58.990950_g4293_i0.p3 GENE.NODE_5740_length_491_cov_58.990950_g4293_i0~~NODE_5740_length_491_cov_58.990950_g4293_i0.p3  ORF type:complete len:103 (-),score=3.96 NODE_5740_length_491_cov_58.990950_g4293_i0:141-449(-)
MEGGGTPTHSAVRQNPTGRSNGGHVTARLHVYPTTHTHTSDPHTAALGHLVDQRRAVEGNQCPAGRWEMDTPPAHTRARPRTTRTHTSPPYTHNPHAKRRGQ